MDMKYKFKHTTGGDMEWGEAKGSRLYIILYFFIMPYTMKRKPQN